MKKAAFYTLGCKVNQYETEAMTEAFEKNGYEITDYENRADIYIINTCTVTNMGDRKSRQIIRRALEINPQAFVAVVGCYSQISPEKVTEIPGVKLVCGTSERSKIVELVERAMEKEGLTSVVGNIMEISEFEDMEINNYKSRTRAFIKIQEGCEQYCTYCIIPYARGHIRSRKLESIINEVKGLAEKGYKEIVVAGIHVGSYGKDFGNIGLIDIIEKIHEVDGIERIRMSSIEPEAVTEDFIKRISKLHKICRHFHLSLQSGCNETLKRMNRKYTVEEYRKSAVLLRATFPGVALTTDLIVGFPGETDTEFEQTYSFVQQIEFSGMHIFKYSPRSGTPAAKFKNQINPQIKEERSKKIIQLAEKCESNFKVSLLGQKLKVLFEQQVEGKDNYYEGLTDNYIRVAVYSPKDITSSILNVSLNEIEGDLLLGEIVK